MQNNNMINRAPFIASNKTDLSVFPFTSSRYCPILSPKLISLDDLLLSKINLTAEEYAYHLTPEILPYLFLSDTFDERLRRGNKQISFTTLITHYFIVMNTISIYHFEFKEYLSNQGFKEIFQDNPFCYIYQYLMTMERLLDAKRTLYLDEISIEQGKHLICIYRSKVDRLLYMLRVTPNQLYLSFLQMIDLYSRITTYVRSHQYHVEILEFAKNLTVKHQRLAKDYHINYMNRTISLYTLGPEKYAEFFHPSFFPALLKGYYKNPKRTPEQWAKDIQLLESLQ